MAAIFTGQGARGDDAWTIDLKPLTRLKMEERGNGHSVSSMSLAHFSKEDAARQSGGYPKEDDDSVLDNQMSFTSRNSNQIRNLLDKFFESESETLEPAKRNNGKHWLLQRKNITTTSLLGVPLEECNREWKPTEWQIMWHCGKADTSSKAEGYDVVPLMEAEFRRDCVVFYNTLFPNIDSGAFQMLREMALSGDGDQRGLRKAGLRAVDVTRKSDFRKSEQDSPAGGWVGRVLSRVSQRRSMGRMVSVFTSVASSRDRPSEGSPKDHEELYKVIREKWETSEPEFVTLGAKDLRKLWKLEPLVEKKEQNVENVGGEEREKKGGQSATSSTNSNSLRGGQGQNSDSDTTSSRGQDDQLYCLKLDMLDNMEQARYVVMPPRAPATGRKSHSDEEGSEDFADLPDEEHVEVGSNQKGRRSTRGDWLQGVETEEEAAEAKAGSTRWFCAVPRPPRSFQSGTLLQAGDA
ncbi:unnamed protein product [Effrenium voratum]|nr:unnamed protein product [Effrenium voratum]